MAAAAGSGEAPLRLRLLFDYPPPGSPACGLCWLLLEPSQVRLVTDIISLIRHKFGFSRHSQLSLFLDGALLPPTESARLVRDNDSLRVKLEEVVREDNYNEFTNGFNNLSKKQRKRHWQTLEAKESESEDGKYQKRKKRKQNAEHLSSQEESCTNIEDSATLRKRKKVVTADSKTDSTSNSKKLKKQANKEKEQKAERDKRKTKTRALKTKNTSQKTNKTFILSPRHKSTTENTKANSSTKKDGTSSDSSTSSSDSDHSNTGAKQKPMPKTKVASEHIDKSQLASIKSICADKPAAKCKNKNSLNKTQSKMVKSQSSSSDSDSSSGELEEQQNSNLKNKLPHNSQGTVTALTSKTKPKTSSSDSDSSESETCIKKPKTNVIVNPSFAENGGKQLPAGIYGPTTNLSNSQRGRGRGENPFWRGPRIRGCRGMIRGRGRGRGENANYFYNYNSEHQKQQQLNETATNTSVIIQNPLEAPKKDYNILPLLAAPPQVGEKIAFKLLELTENYTPEVSDYKEGKIVSWNPANKQLELEILSFSSVTKEPGKFDLVYQSADGAETIEYAVSQDRKITQSWDALIEPRLIVEPPDSQPSPKNGNPSDVNLCVPCVNSL